MTDKMRWRYGDTNPVVAAVQSATVIAIGDLVYLDGDNIKPAASLPNQGSPTANQQLFSEKFLGVAMQRSLAGNTTPVRVATTGVFEFDCGTGTFELGDLIGAAENTAANGLQSQQVIKVSPAKYAVGRVAKRAPQPVSDVLVDIRSTIMTGGVEGSSYSGGHSGS